MKSFIDTLLNMCTVYRVYTKFQVMGNNIGTVFPRSGDPVVIVNYFIKICQDFLDISYILKPVSCDLINFWIF